MNRNAILCAVLGAIGGGLAFLISSPFLADVGKQNVHPDYTLGSVFGWLSHGLLGAFICGSISAVLGYIDSGRRGAILAAVFGFLLGAVGGWGSDALFDWLMIQNRDLRTGLGPVLHFLWSVFVCTALSLVIFLSTGCKRDRFVRCAVAAGVATVVGGIVRQAVGILVVAILIGGGGIGGSKWTSAGPGMLAEYIAIGLVLGGIFGIVESVMKPVRLRQVLGRNEWRTWSLGEGTYRVGSAEGSEIRVTDSQLQPLHAYVMRQRGQFCIQTANGSLTVNGVQTPAHWLSNGDVIQLGSAVFLFGDGDIAAASREPRPASLQTPTPSVPVLDHRLIDGFGTIYPLDRGTHVIGRDATVTVSIPWDDRVSRRHAEITIDPTGATLSDLGSRNGTSVNGQPTQGATPLQPGSQIQVGSTTLIYKS